MKTRIPVRKQDSVLPNVRMFSEELAAIKTAASQANVTLTEYVRNKLLADLQPIISHFSKKDSILESARDSNQRKTEKLNEKLSASEIDGICARKTNHVLGCDCVVCEKQRRRLREFLGKQSASD